MSEYDDWACVHFQFVFLRANVVGFLILKEDEEWNRRMTWHYISRFAFIYQCVCFCWIASFTLPFYWSLQFSLSFNLSMCKIHTCIVRGMSYFPTKWAFRSCRTFDSLSKLSDVWLFSVAFSCMRKLVSDDIGTNRRDTFKDSFEYGKTLWSLQLRFTIKMRTKKSSSRSVLFVSVLLSLDWHLKYLASSTRHTAQHSVHSLNHCQKKSKATQQYMSLEFESLGITTETFLVIWWLQAIGQMRCCTTQIWCTKSIFPPILFFLFLHICAIRIEMHFICSQ